mmetsp:Transcript_51302/g.133259  ORF Transcript_51302/g.133259 Transcript_51302/m.133259 type:complete len:381 (-) Transcript_51302:156-1298(-)
MPSGDYCMLLLLSLPMRLAFELWLDRTTKAVLPKLPPGLFDRELGSNSLRVVDGKLLNEDDSLFGAVLSVPTPSAQFNALALVGSANWIYIDETHAPMITAENLLAAAEGTPTQLAMRCTRISDVNGLAFALQFGVDALVVSATMLCEDEELIEALEIVKAQRLERTAEQAEAAGIAESDPISDDVEPLATATITNISSGGVGDRVCLDLTRLLEEGEGCLIGSSAKSLALVLGETATSGYVPPRPFRCNAGPVHAYVLLADGSSKYLSEVVAGDAILVMRSSDGRRRSCTIGRCKVEPRPLVKIEFALDGEGELSEGDAVGVGLARGQLFLQMAETVRLAGEGGGLPVTHAKPGDALLVRVTSFGTHVGRTIKAKVTER